MRSPNLQAPGCPQKVDLEFLRWIWSFPRRTRPRMLATLERHAATTSGSGLGLWIANAFIASNGGKMNAVSAGPGLGTAVAIDLPVTQAAVPQLEGDTDE